MLYWQCSQRSHDVWPFHEFPRTHLRFSRKTFRVTTSRFHNTLTNFPHSPYGVRKIFDVGAYPKISKHVSVPDPATLSGTRKIIDFGKIWLFWGEISSPAASLPARASRGTEGTDLSGKWRGHFRPPHLQGHVYQGTRAPARRGGAGAPHS